MLTPEQERRAEKIFEILLELPSAEREARIKGECGADSALAAEVRLLLAHYEAASPDFLQSPAHDSVHTQSLENIGPYELKEVLGEGGMGVVYRAEQRTPVARTVALKILKLGMDSTEILARFEAERQTLARLEHPNIARVYDAGRQPTAALTSSWNMSRARPSPPIAMPVASPRASESSCSPNFVVVCNSRTSRASFIGT